MNKINISSMETLNKNLAELGFVNLNGQNCKVHNDFVLDIVNKDGEHSFFDLRTGKPFLWGQNLSENQFLFYDEGILEIKRDGKYSLYDLLAGVQFVYANNIDADSIHVYNGEILEIKKNKKYSFKNLYSGQYFNNAKNISATRTNVHNGRFLEIEKNGKYSFFDLKTGKFIVKELAAEDVSVDKNLFVIFKRKHGLSYCDLSSGVFSARKQSVSGKGILSEVHDKEVIEFVTQDRKCSYKSVETGKWIIRDCDFGVRQEDGNIVVLKNHEFKLLPLNNDSNMTKALFVDRFHNKGR